jgi:hypothetical protein
MYVDEIKGEIVKTSVDEIKIEKEMKEDAR